MRNRSSWIYILLVAAAAVGMIMLLTHTAQAGGGDPCASYSKTTDTDGDGIMDYDECTGISLGGKTRLKLDPKTRDLFYIVVTPGQWWPPNNPLQYISNPLLDSNSNPNGLGVVVHQITSSQVKNGTARTVNFPNSNQNAVQVTDSPNMTGDLNLLGISNTGTPNGLDLSTVYTQKIYNFIKSVCQNAYGTTNCIASTGEYDGSPADTLALTHKYVIHTINHEVGHTIGPLAPVYNANYGGYHYAPGTNSIMDQSIYYTSKSGTITFYIGTTYTPADQTGIKLK